MKFTHAPESKPLAGFTIKRAIHRGGFGEVYYALTDAGKEVALKLLHTHSDIELRGTKQCLNLHHPNLVTLFDIRNDGDGDSWVVMEYVGGKRLADVLEDRRTLPVEEIEHWLDGLAAGLTFLHDRGLVHRDLKPANVYRENGVVKIGDVGLSKLVSDNRRSAHTQSVGTVYYMAPEVARGRYGREVDVYALGIMLFEMLTGDVPFDGESTGEILMKHLTQKPDLSALPERLRAVIGRSLEKDPAQRTPTAARLRDEFKAAVRGRVLEGSDRYSHDERRRAAAAYAEGAKKINGRDPCGSTGSCGKSKVRGPREYVADAYNDANRHWPRDAGRMVGGAMPNGWSAEKKRRAIKIAIFVGLFLLFFTSGGRRLLPLLIEVSIFSAIAFAAYVVVRKLTGWGSNWHTPTPAPVVVPPPPVSHPNAASPGEVAHRVPVRYAREVVLPAGPVLRKLSKRQRIRELAGGMTVASLATATITIGLTILQFLDNGYEAVLFGTTGVVAAWGLLAVTKLTEGHEIDGLFLRSTQAAIGAGTGAVAYFLDEILLTNFTTGDSMHGAIRSIGELPLAYPGGDLLLPGFMVFFAGLFGLRRWSRLTDAWRTKRLRISSVLVTIFLGYVLTTIFAFPHMWAMMWSATIACVVQLAAAWTPLHSRRREIENAASVGVTAADDTSPGREW